MKHRSLTAAFALGLLLAVASTASAARNPFGDAPHSGDLINGRSCGAPEPTAMEMDAVGTALRRYIEEGRASATGQIKVAWHVISNGTTGNVAQSAIDAQIAYMNQRYAGTGFSFVLASVDRTSNSKYFSMTPGSRNETNCKNALAIDPLHRFNVYSAAPGQGLLGWATFPWSYAESSKMHGVVIHYGSLPGGSIANYNEGGTLAHEAGHYLGLYHTFQGGCTAPGDQVDDTPYEATSTTGCPSGKDTCPATGLDPIHNYMDYSYDACYTEFTPMQISRMQSSVGTYRPNLPNAAVAQAKPEPVEAARMTGAVAFRNIYPNPFTSRTNVQLVMPRAGQVMVKVYNVAGALVETLADGEYAAGEHSLAFSAKQLAPGTYFVRATAAGKSVARAVVLIK
ncbi:MAG: T9SS type A sorting domain-containing protein [Candidatus Eisenbacteria bacterium]|uniref:T9SS type A sorting domain-containing protein n=1 Tax=Eiseniibacteriota bacterium TaxID=2212470 RepID=A0A933SC88_UNCEI|nr:T9SS type A sorting domain-containing protein [Candidatus Eisenbacteria bacterium]